MPMGLRILVTVIHACKQFPVPRQITDYVVADHSASFETRPCSHGSRVLRWASFAICDAVLESPGTSGQIPPEMSSNERQVADRLACSHCWREMLSGRRG